MTNIEISEAIYQQADDLISDLQMMRAEADEMGQDCDRQMRRTIAKALLAATAAVESRVKELTLQKLTTLRLRYMLADKNAKACAIDEAIELLSLQPTPEANQ